EASVSRLRRLMGTYKAPRIAKLISDELDDGAYRKVVVLYYHREVGRLLRERLAPHGVVGFDGSTPRPSARPPSMPSLRTRAFACSSRSKAAPGRRSTCRPR